MTELLAFIDVQLAATNFSTALARTVEKAASFKTEDISVTISNPRACKLGRIQELLGKEDSKFDDDIKERPDVRGWSRVTWYRYGWAEFAVRDEVVVAVRGNTTGFLRKE